MKTLRLSDSRLFVPSVAVFWLGCALTLTLTAQQTPPVRSPNAPAHAAQGALRFDLVIADGKLMRDGRELEAALGNVVEVLRERYTNANLALSPRLAALKITNLKLRGGQLWEALEALRVASGEGFDWYAPDSGGPNRPPGSGEQIDPFTGRPRPQLVDLTRGPDERDLNRGLFMLREPPPRPERQRIIEAFNLSGYLDWWWNQLENPPEKTRQKFVELTDQGLREVMEIIENTIKTLAPNARLEVGSGEMPIIRFHRGANLLVVGGTAESVDLVRKLIAALPGQRDAELRQPGTTQTGQSSLQGLDPAIRDAFQRRYGINPGGTSAPQPATPAAPVSPR